MPQEKKLNPQGLNRRQFITRTAVGAGAVVLAGSWKGRAQTWDPSFSGSEWPEPWKFGVMNDTQWTISNSSGYVDDGYDPDSCAVGILRQIQRQFIAHRVKFVVHVGDLCDNGSLTGEDIRTLYAQPLYNHKIGFFPLRGNHDDAVVGGPGVPSDGTEFQALYPQTQNGTQNATPSAQFANAATWVEDNSSDATNIGIPSAPGPHASFKVGENFSSPTVWGGGLKGLSYSFDFRNSRFILLDQFTPVGLTSTTGFDAGPGSGSPTTINLQQPWITAQLSGRPQGTHAFVFSHKGLVTCQHADCLFGNNPSQNPTYVNTFINSLASNGVHYYIHGHDHMYDRSFVSNDVPPGRSGSMKVTQILTSSNSSKFYIPSGALCNSAKNGGLSNDAYYDLNGALGFLRRQPLSQQLCSIGFQIFTVDGPNLTVDYYAYVFSYEALLTLNTGNPLLDSTPTSELQFPSVSTYSFTKQERFGYSLVGKEFVVLSGEDYTSVEDTSALISREPTTAKILSGTNSSQATDANDLLLSKSVNTGWKCKDCDDLASDIFLLWGMGSALGSEETDTFVLSLSYDMEPTAWGAGDFGIVSRDERGNWVNAVNKNFGGSKKFVHGPWQAGYGLGTYGVDSSSKIAWAVINYNGEFATARDIEPFPGFNS